MSGTPAHRIAQRAQWRATERARREVLHRHPPADRPPEDECPRHPGTALTFGTEDGWAYQYCARCGAARYIPRVAGLGA